MSADDENPHDDKPLEDEAMDGAGDRPNQTQEPAPINDEKNSENDEEGQFEAENNEENPSPSEVNNVQIENAGENNSAKAVKKSRLKLILPLYLVGLISLSIAALGFCFAPFTEYVHANYKFVPTSNFLWIWICAIIAGTIFLIDLIVVLSLKGAKRIGSLKKLFLARFSLPLAASVIACVIIGLIGGTSYYNRYKAEELARKEYGENDKTLNTPITSPSTILGQAYNQCYPPTGVTESGSYYIDSYEASITGEAGTLTGGATSAELLQTTIELGCVLNALNIQSPQSGSSALNYLLTDAASNASTQNDMIGQKNLIASSYEVSVLTLVTTNLSAPSPISGIIFTISPHPMLTDGYKWNIAAFPNINTINANATFDSSASNSVSVLSALIEELDQIIADPSEDGEYNFSSLSANSFDTNKDSNANSSGNLNNQSTPPATTPNNSDNFSSTSSSANSANQSTPSPSDSSPSTPSSGATNPNINGGLNSTSNENDNDDASLASNSEAITAMNNAEECSNIYSFYNYMDVESQQVVNGGNIYSVPYILVKGGGKWGKVWACVAQKLQMPSPIEVKLKIYLNSSNPHYQNLSTNWGFHDGSKIYLNYEGPLALADNNTGWITRISVTKNAISTDN